MGNRDPGAWEVLAPVPADAPAAPRAHYKLGKPTGTWTYRDASGAVLGYVMRFDTSDGKIFLPVTFCEYTGHGRSEWLGGAISASSLVRGDSVRVRLALAIQHRKCQHRGCNPASHCHDAQV